MRFVWFKRMYGYGWELTGFIGKGGLWFLGFSRAHELKDSDGPDPDPYF